MKDVFRPVIEEVLALLNDQIKAASKEGPISAVILVGGFGESTYLHRQIKQAVSPIPVLQPPNGSVHYIEYSTLSQSIYRVYTDFYFP